MGVLRNDSVFLIQFQGTDKGFSQFGQEVKRTTKECNKMCIRDRDAIPALQILAPTIFLSGILGVFRGYFQAYRNMMPTSISQIIEQVLSLIHI